MNLASYIRTSMSDVLSSVRLYIIQFSKCKNSLLYDKFKQTRFNGWIMALSEESVVWV